MSDRGLSNHPLIVLLGAAASAVAIFIFVTGKSNLPDLAKRTSSTPSTREESKVTHPVPRGSTNLSAVSKPEKEGGRPLVDGSGTVTPLIEGTDTTYDVSEIIELNLRQGQDGWIPRIRERIAGSFWTFYADGSFQYSPADSRDDLFPMRGRYQCTGKICTLSAQASATIGETGAASAKIDGTLYFGTVGPVLDVVQVNSMGNAARVNGTNWGQASSSSYRFVVGLKQKFSTFGALRLFEAATPMYERMWHDEKPERPTQALHRTATALCAFAAR